MKARFLFRRQISIAWAATTAGSVFVVAVTAGAASLPPAAQRAVIFQTEIAPIFQERCISCHGAEKEKGGLRLDDRKLALRGGDEGTAIVPGDSAKSLLIQLVAGVDEDRIMPAKGPRLSAEEIGLLRAWVDQGAKWPEKGVSTARDPRLEHWAFQPVRRFPALEAVDPVWRGNAIDAFVLAKLEEKNLKPSPEADRATLVRRISFGLTGLPPTLQQVDSFVKSASPNALPQLVDRLLDSPRYGERWARHWLDVARFCESQGFERDKIRPNSWRYRDYVINSLNEDKPYDVFVREQIAGDVLPGVTSERIVATGFLVAGPYDEVGLNQQSKIMRSRAREEELEDVVSVVGQTFLGLTVNCARCHSHKFDPITHEDYYQLKAVFEGVRPGDKDILTAAQLKEKEAEKKRLFASIYRLRRARANLEKKVMARLLARPGDVAEGLPRPLLTWEFESDAHEATGLMKGTLLDGARIENGRLILDGKKAYVKTTRLFRDLRARTFEVWAAITDLKSRGGGLLTLEQVDSSAFDSIVFGEREAGKWIAGSNAFRRTRNLQAPAETTASDDLTHLVIVYAEDGTITLYRNGKVYGAPYKPTGPQSELQTYKKGQSFFLFGKRHTGGGKPFFAGEIDEARVYDRALSSSELQASFAAGPRGIPLGKILSEMTAEQRAERSRLNLAIEREKAAYDAAATRPRAYAAIAAQPAITHRLARGDAGKPREAVSPAGLSAITKPSPDFGLKPDAPEAQRRIRLAVWITDPQNPLVARVIVNRVWHYHFGAGIVSTPNDLGLSGGRPSHPKLLDHLAAEFIANGWSLKWLHKKILLSRTYRQSSAHYPEAVNLDADNRLLWRHSPRRLEAEAVRDALLAVSGQLNLRMGGSGYMPWNLHIDNTHFYDWEDKIGEDFNRRTVYRLGVQSARDPLLDSLDCPDLSTKTPVRASTTTPIQALALMNNSVVQRQAQMFAERLIAEAPSSVEAQITRAYRLAYARAPKSSELARDASASKELGLPTVCWAIFNSSEFVYLR
jgi:mono/diheme cytochrome c family protein